MATVWFSVVKPHRELAMLEAIYDTFSRVRDFIDGLRRPPAFVCGDCDRNQHCGLPPHEDCIQKAIQRERDPNGRILLAKRRAQAQLRSVVPL